MSGTEVRNLAVAGIGIAAGVSLANGFSSTDDGKDILELGWVVILGLGAAINLLAGILIVSSEPIGSDRSYVIAAVVLGSLSFLGTFGWQSRDVAEEHADELIALSDKEKPGKVKPDRMSNNSGTKKTSVEPGIHSTNCIIGAFSASGVGSPWNDRLLDGYNETWFFGADNTGYHRWVPAGRVPPNDKGYYRYNGRTIFNASAIVERRIQFGFDARTVIKDGKQIVLVRYKPVRQTTARVDSKLNSERSDFDERYRTTMGMTCKSGPRALDIFTEGYFVSAG